MCGKGERGGGVFCFVVKQLSLVKVDMLSIPCSAHAIQLITPDDRCCRLVHRDAFVSGKNSQRWQGEEVQHVKHGASGVPARVTSLH